MNLSHLMVGSLLVLSSSFALEIIGHRGASADAPENTLAAFKLAYEQGADAAELDVHLTKDGKAVVMHDADTKRTGGVDRKLTDQNFEDIRQLNVGNFGSWQGKGFNEKAPSLSEALALVPPGKRMFIEIKCRSEILPALAEAIKESKLSPRQLPIITFHYEVAAESKKLFPAHEVFWLVSWAKDKQTGEYPNLDDLIKKTKEARLDGLDLQYRFPIDSAFVEKVHQAGLKLYTWTVDDLEVARSEKAAKVDGITTNKPGWLREQLAK